MPTPKTLAEPLMTLEGHASFVMSVAVYAKDRRVLSGSFDRTLKVWDLETGRVLQNLKGHTEPVYHAVVFAGDRRALSASSDGTLKVWDLENGHPFQTLEGDGREVVFAVVFAGDQRVLSGSVDGTLKVWDLGSGQLLQSLEGHKNRVRHAVVFAEGRRVLSVSDDRTLKVWDLESGRLLQSLEGHARAVRYAVVFAGDRRALTASEDGTLKVWDLESGQLLQSIQAHDDYVRSVAVYAGGRRAISASDDNTLKVWDLAALEGAGPREKSSVYLNAKVALVGDSGVGKSGLRLVLEGKPFAATDSTHGRYVTTFEKTEVPHGADMTLHRETLLWDLAGQPNYRLINQLHLRDVAVALVIFDSRSDIDPFAGVRHWNRALEVARKGLPSGAPRLRKFLVAARTDRGTVGVGRERIERLIEELGFEKEWFETSAKEGHQIAELGEAIRAGIPWSEMPTVVSTELFQQIKAFLVETKKSGRVLAEEGELLGAFNAGDRGQGTGDRKQGSGDRSQGTGSAADSDSCSLSPDSCAGAASREQFATCVDRLRETGLIVRLAFGDLLLLQPEVLDNYASALINTARQQPDGFGCIGEDEVLAGKFEVPKEERLGSKAQEKLLLIAMVQDLLAHQIALREPGEQGMMLVFPSQFTRENPHLPEPEGKAVRFEFAGPVTSIYTTLAVRLSQSGTFTHKELWRNAVTYRPADGAGECGFFLQEVDEGHGRLTIFHAEATGVRMRELFEAFVENHLRTHALAESVTSRRVVVCADCKTPVSDIVLERVLARGREAIECQVCGATIAVKAVPAGAVLSKTAEDVREMDREADKNRGLAEATAILKGKIERGDFDVFLCHRSPDKPAVKKIGEALKERGILPWLDEWEIKPGERWQDVLQKQIKSIKAVIVCLSDTDIARYQQLELDGFVAEFVDRSLPVIPVILEGTIGEPKKPPFLAGFHAVDFRKSDPDPVEQLLWGITGNRGDGRDGGRISPDA